MFVFRCVADILSLINPTQLMSRVFLDPKIQSAFIDAITLRLDEKGITASGKKLETNQAIRQDIGKFYSVYNIEKANNPHVDLYDTGDFYESFNIDVSKKGGEVKASFDKPEGNIYDNFNLSFNSQETFENEILMPIVDQYFKEFAVEDVVPAFFEVLSEFIIIELKKIS